MKIVKKAALLALAALSSGPALAGNSLTPHKAEYKVKISVVSGQLNTELSSTPNGYVARHIIKPVGMSKMLTRGSMDVTSQFDRHPDGVKPVSYRAVDTIRKDPEVNLSFDWDNNQASGTVGTEEVLLPLKGISHDSVSIQYELMHDLMNGGPSDQYVLFDVNKMRVANVSTAGTREVRTKAGTYTAVGVRHQKAGSSRVTTMWCVEELDFLPVIIEQHRKGKLNFRATLVSYTPTG